VELDSALTFVVERFNAMLAADGARLDVVSATPQGVTLRYAAGADGGCEACVLDPDDLDVLVADALARQGAHAPVTILR
jgi:Fe-S cluster biogenesis protein NfuA